MPNKKGHDVLSFNQLLFGLIVLLIFSAILVPVFSKNNQNKESFHKIILDRNNV